MNPLTKLIKSLSENARKKRSNLFKKYFYLNQATKILDLGSENGSNINNVLKGTDISSKNVYISDINEKVLQEGQSIFGFNPVPITETGILPFKDKFFDIVFCSSVIEHVTVPKESIWGLSSTQLFKEESFKRQKEFSEEIKRLGKQYFVQTPYRYFPVESHTWLPLIGFLPRPALTQILKFTNCYWIKKTNPDWNLLNKTQMKILFAEAEIIEEKVCGLTKSIMAVKSNYKY